MISIRNVLLEDIELTFTFNDTDNKAHLRFNKIQIKAILELLQDEIPILQVMDLDCCCHITFMRFNNYVEYKAKAVDGIFFKDVHVGTIHDLEMSDLINTLKEYIENGINPMVK